MAILVQSGRAAMAIAIRQQAIHLAWGIGDPAWDVTSVPEPSTATTLVAEVGRHAVSIIKYCVPDPSGLIVVPTGRFSESATPTNNLFMQFDFGYTDASDVDLREVGVFVGTVTDPLLPPGQVYFEPGEVDALGTLLVLERFPKFPRSTATRQSFQFVVTF